MESNKNSIPTLPPSFNQLMEYQLSLREMLDQENSRFNEFTQPLDIDALVGRASHYLLKLNNIKKDMDALSEKVGKIKKRALKLQEMVQNQTLEKEMRKDEQYQREKQLAPVILGKEAKK